MGKRSEQIDELTAEVARLREEVARLRNELAYRPVYQYPSYAPSWIEPGYVPGGVKIWCNANKINA